MAATSDANGCRIHASSMVGWALLCGLGCATSRSPEPPIASTSAPSASTEPASTKLPTSAPEPALEGYTPEVAAVLAEKFLTGFHLATTIEVERRGAVRLLPNGPDLGLRDKVRFPSAKRLYVLEDSERPRVAYDDERIRLLLHVDRQDARPVLLRRAPLRPEPQATVDDPPTRGHTILLPGAWVDVIATDGTMAHVSYGEPEPELSGWIEADALGTTYTRPPPTRGPYPETERTKRSTKLLVRPKGKALATIPSDDVVLPLAPPAKDGYRLVEYGPVCEFGFVYVGFVRQRDLHREGLGAVIGCGRYGSAIPLRYGEAESTPRVKLLPGRFLLDADSPTIVGCVYAEAEVAELSDERYAVATIWGPVLVRVAPEDFPGACATTFSK